MTTAGRNNKVLVALAGVALCACTNTGLHRDVDALGAYEGLREVGERHPPRWRESRAGPSAIPDLWTTLGATAPCGRAPIRLIAVHPPREGPDRPVAGEQGAAARATSAVVDDEVAHAERVQVPARRAPELS